MSQEESTLGGRYGALWDAYVEEWPAGAGRRDELSWPGDEWGSVEYSTALFERLCPVAGAWSHVVELGPGSGKFTAFILERSPAEVLAFDVSARYLAVCAERLSSAATDGRLTLAQIDAADPASVLDRTAGQGWRGSVDAVVSFDAMVHVDLQYLIGYLVTAGLVLRPGGELILTLANATSDGGFAKLLRDIRGVAVGQAALDAPGRRFTPPGFAWSSPDLMRSVLARLGFEVSELGVDGRDLELRATLQDPARSADLERFLRSSG